MAKSRSHAGWWVPALVAVGAVGATLAAGAAAITLLFARTVVTPPTRREEDIRVLSVGDGTITLSITAESTLRGRYSFWFANDLGHARLGEVVSLRPDGVTRELIGVDFGDLGAAKRGRFSGWFYLDPRELGYPYQNIELETDLGAAPAWLVPAAEASDRWVIAVHGRAVRRTETLRAVPVFHEAGYNSLLISYRNDGDAPRSADGRYALGDTEWRDVDVALRYAEEHGAREIVLMGWSMGGATVLQALTRSSHAGLVRGVVLDSPVIDWVTALRYQGELRRLPTPIRSGVIALIGTPRGARLTGQEAAIDLGRLDFVHRAVELSVPVLLMHSDEDGFVPASASRLLAEARPDIVTFDSWAEGAHTKLWNFDTEHWNASISSWLQNLSAGR
jgi:alpha-beta hydrolase superfamily lysophospholipase